RFRHARTGQLPRHPDHHQRPGAGRRLVARLGPNALDTTAGLGINDLVTGITNLTLDGVLQVTGSGDFTTVAEGTAWRLFEYNGTLDDRTLVFGDMPQLASGLQWSIDTGTTGQV